MNKIKGLERLCLNCHHVAKLYEWNGFKVIGLEKEFYEFDKIKISFQFLFNISHDHCKSYCPLTRAGINS